MPEKEPTQPKLDEKTQQRLIDIDAELYVFKQKAKGDAKNNLKLVEMERAKELILEKRELMGEKLVGRDAVKLVEEFFEWKKTHEYWQNVDEVWSYKVAKDGKYFRLNVGDKVNKIPDQYFDKDIRELDFDEQAETRIGSKQLVKDLVDKRVVSIRTKENRNWYLKVVEEVKLWDVKKEISKDTLESITEYANILRGQEEWNQFLIEATHIKIIDPNIDLKISAQELQIVTDSYRQDINRGYIVAAMETAMNLKIIDPSTMFALSPERLDDLAENSKGIKNDKSWWGLSQRLVRCKVANLQVGIEVTQNDWSKMRKRLETLRETKEWYMCLSMAAAMKIVNPKIDIGLTSSDWQDLKKTLEAKKSSERWPSFSQLASYMRIVAAKSVKVTDRGLEIID